MKSVCIALALSGLAQASPSTLRRLQADTTAPNEPADLLEEMSLDLKETESSLYAALGVDEPPEPESDEPSTEGLDKPRRRAIGYVQVCVKLKWQGVTYNNVQGLTVKCYDEDDVGSDDHIMTMTTGHSGCARGYYRDDGSDDYDHNSYADLYCEVTSGRIGIMPSVTHVATNHKASNGFAKTINAYIDRVRYNWTGQQPNGCSDSDVWAPVWSALSNMGPVCNQHDLCYANCYQSQKECDDEFLDLMDSRCRKLFSDSGSNFGICRHIMANLMHAGVNSQLGTDAYNAAQKNC